MFLLVVLGVKIRALCMLRKTAKFRKIIKICLRNFLFVKGMWRCGCRRHPSMDLWPPRVPAQMNIPAHIHTHTHTHIQNTQDTVKIGQVDST